MKICYSCGKEIKLESNPTRNAVCEKCGAFLRVCPNCSLFNKLSNRCAEVQAEWVSDREKSTFCEYFNFKNKEKVDTEASDIAQRQKFDDIFKF